MKKLISIIFILSRKKLFQVSVRRIVLCLLLFFCAVTSSAMQGVAITGNWASPGTWLFEGVSRVPTCSDTLIIPSGVVVTVTSQLDYTACGVGMFISVEGTLQFANGNKLDLPCSSSVFVLSGGIIKKATAGSGNSSYIHMCGCSSWQAGDGTVSGPQVLGCSVLPISLISFTAEGMQDNIAISWITASETNNDYFTLERSADGVNFNPITNIPGAGTTSVIHDYYYEDYDPLNNISYYRLKQTDYDGKSSYSDVIVIKYNNKNVFKIISSSVDENRFLDLKYFGLRKEEISVSIYNLTGKLIYEFKFYSVAGINQIKLQLSLDKSGCYLLNLSNGEEIVTEKIFIALK